MKRKSSLKETITDLLLESKDEVICVNFLRYNGAGENEAMENEFKSKGLGVVLKFSGSRTPKRNGKV